MTRRSSRCASPSARRWPRASRWPCWPCSWPGEGGVAGAEARPTAAAPASDAPRDDLQAVRDRHAIGLDAARPEAVAKRRSKGRRTARENLADLLDPGSFVEYGPLMFAAQERRRSTQELIERTPADGLVGGVGTIDGEPCVALSYDYTVLAGTQGMRNHEKKDRLFELAHRRRLPVVLFAEGGGGRPGDVDVPTVAGLDVRAFELFAQLSGLVPLVGIASGYCFAGNAALLGCCDVVIATEDASIGMGGPAMIEGGGLGAFAPARRRPHRCPGRQRGRRPAGGRRRRRGGRRPALSAGTSGARLRVPADARPGSASAPIRGGCATSSPSTASASTRSAP